MSSPTEDTEKPSEAEKRKDLLSYLESEIKLITEVEKFPGWTNWAILVGVGSLVWTFVGLLGGKINLHLTLAMAIIFGSILDCGFLTYGFTSFIRKKTNGRTRYDMAIKIFENPLLIGFSLFRFIVAISVVWSLPLTSMSRTTVSAFYGLYMLSIALGAFNAIKEVPVVRGGVPKQESQVRQVTEKAFFISIAIVLLVASIMCIQLSDWWSFKAYVTELKGALIIVALFYLCGLALNRPGKNPLIENLISIRRQLGLGQLSIQAAREQSEIALTGFDEAYILKEKLSLMLTCYENASQELQAIETAISDAKQKVPQTEGPFNDQEYALICKTRKFIEDRFRRIGEIDKTYAKHLSKFNYWIRIFIAYDPDSGTRMMPLTEKLNVAAAEYNRRNTELGEKGVWFVKAVDAAKQTLPTNAAPTTPTT